MDFYRDEKNKDRVHKYLGEYYRSNVIEELEETRRTYSQVTPGLPLITAKAMENVIANDRNSGRDETECRRAIGFVVSRAARAGKKGEGTVVFGLGGISRKERQRTQSERSKHEIRNPKQTRSQMDLKSGNFKTPNPNETCLEFEFLVI